jgi:Fe2+ or Zn2+ uptake regulation protein
MDYTEALRNCSLKATTQRLKLAEILHYKGHLSIEQIYENMRKDLPSVSLATVYKNVNLMVENEFLSILTMPCHKLVYEIEKSNHSHLHCIMCHTISDIKISLVKISKEIEMQNGFSVTSHNTVFDGTCAECKCPRSG